MYGKAVRAGRMRQEAAMDLRLLVCLTDMSSQASVVAIFLFVCLHDTTPIIHHTSVGLFTLQNVNDELFLWKYTPRLCTMFVRMKVYVQFSSRICCVSLTHITACFCSTDVLELSMPFFLPSLTYSLKSMRLTSAHLGRNLLYLFWVHFFLSSCQIPHWDTHSGVWPLTIILEVSVGRILIEELEDGEAKSETEWGRHLKKGVMAGNKREHEAEISGSKGYKITRAAEWQRDKVLIQNKGWECQGWNKSKRIIRKINMLQEVLPICILLDNINFARLFII